MLRLVPRGRDRHRRRSSRRGGRPAAGARPSIHGVLDVRVAEQFRRGAQPDDEDAYPLDDEQVDLFDLVRDAVVLELPLAPLCREDCAGLCATCGADRNEDAVRVPAGRPTRGGLHSMRSACRTRPSRCQHPRAHPRGTMAVPKRKTSKAKSRSRRAANWQLARAGAQRLPALRAAPRRRTWSARTAGGTRIASPSRSTELTPGAPLPVALDAMGGDRAPAEIVAGARAAVDELGIAVVLVGPPDLVGDTLGLELVACTEVIAMDDDPAQSVRRKKDSSIVRARRARARRRGVRDGVGRQHRAPPWPRRCCGSGGSRAWCGRASRRRSRGRARRPSSSATPARTPSARPRCSCSSPRWASAHATSRYGVDAPARRAALDRRGADQGHAAREGDPRAARGPRQRHRRSTATSRAATSSARPWTSSSPTASPATWR